MTRKGYTGIVSTIAFSADGRNVLSDSCNHIIKVRPQRVTSLGRGRYTPLIQRKKQSCSQHCVPLLNSRYKVMMVRRECGR